MSRRAKYCLCICLLLSIMNLFPTQMQRMQHGINNLSMSVFFISDAWDPSFLSIAPLIRSTFFFFVTSLRTRKQGLQSAHQLALMHPTRTVLVLLQQDIQPNVVQTFVQWSQQRLVSFFVVVVVEVYRWAFLLVAN